MGFACQNRAIQRPNQPRLSADPGPLPRAVGGELQVHLCERCYAPIDIARERYTTLAHVDRVLPDGSIAWVHSALHADACGEPARERSAAEPPDTGEWDPSRRGHSPAAAQHAARRTEPRDVRTSR
jgi:hypothetical protein